MDRGKIPSSRMTSTTHKIAHVVKGVYGNAEHPYLKIVCIIQTEDVYFTTNLYFKAGGTIKSDRRLWHFCECIGVREG
jgi:rRNA processing protein Gar1